MINFKKIIWGFLAVLVKDWATVRRALIAPKSLLVGLVTQTDWIGFITVFILIILKISVSSNLNNLGFDQNHLIENPILFCKYLRPLISQRNGFVFKICVWITVFRRKNDLKIQYLVAKILCKNPVLFFLGHPVFQ